MHFSKMLVVIYHSAQCDILDNVTFISTALRTCSLKFYCAEDTLISQYVILCLSFLHLVALRFIMMNCVKLVMFQTLCFSYCSHGVYFLN